MTIEVFLLYNVIMFGVGWYLLQKYGESKYQAGVVEAVQMHNEGRLTYTSYFDDEGIEMIDIQIKPYEE